MSLDPTSGPHFAFGQFGKVVQVPCGQKKNRFMPDLTCEQSLIPDFSRKIEGDSACLQSALDQTPSK